MPYQINRHADNMLWVTIEGHMPMEYVENYFQEMWPTLDDCPHPTDILVDGRLMHNSAAARASAPSRSPTTRTWVTSPLWWMPSTC